MKYGFSMLGNNLSHLVLSWWSKETAMMINFVLDFSSQTFLAHSLIDLHKSSHFELSFHFLRTSVGFDSLDCENLSHFLCSHIFTAPAPNLRNFLEHVQWTLRRLHAIWNSDQVSQKSATLSKKVQQKKIESNSGLKFNTWISVSLIMKKNSKNFLYKSFLWTRVNHWPTFGKRLPV